MFVDQFMRNEIAIKAISDFQLVENHPIPANDLTWMRDRQAAGKITASRLVLPPSSCSSRGYASRDMQLTSNSMLESKPSSVLKSSQGACSA